MIRDIELRDLVMLEKLHDDKFPLPKLNKYSYPSQKVIEIDGKIIGFAYLHLTSEVSLILDQSLNCITRAKAIKEFFGQLNQELQNNALEDTHVFVLPENDEKYAKFLIKNFGFVKATGIPLYRSL